MNSSYTIKHTAGISLEINLIELLEFEPTYFAIAVWHVSHYAKVLVCISKNSIKQNICLLTVYIVKQFYLTHR